VWFIGIAAVLALVIGIAIEESGRRAPMPYGAFLDQLDADNVASVTFQGTDIDGILKRPLDSAPSNNTTQRTTFRSHVPSFGDPALLPQLRKQHVVIDVTSSSSWKGILAGIPVPMVLFLAVILIGGVVRLVRGGKTSSGSAMPMGPMQGIVGLVSGIFGKKEQAAESPAHDGGAPKNG
jgi:hypothetical protein